MKTSKENLALLIIGFDGYSDLWSDYFKLIDKYWADRPYRTYLSNNEIECDYDNVITINAGKEAEWSRKAQVALKEIEEDYVCLLLEDFFTGDFVDNTVVSEVMNFIEKEKIRYYKLNNFSKKKTKKYNSSNHLHIIPGNQPYGISLQPAIWKKEFLAELLGTDNYNAWNFEFDRVKESASSDKSPLEGCLYDDRNILKIQHGVVQGKFLPPVVKYFNSIGYSLDTTRRGVMPFKSFVFYKLKGNASRYLPKFTHKAIKKFLNIFGMEFVSDKHS